MKNLILCILSSFILSVTYAKDFVIKDANKLITKQRGAFWCWAATLEAIAKFKNEVIIPQEDIVASRFPTISKEYINLYRNSPDFSMAPITIEVILKPNRIIEKEQIEERLKTQKPVIYVANNHVSLIVGYNKKEYIIMDTWEGSIYKMPKTSFENLGLDSVYIHKPAQFFEVI